MENIGPLRQKVAHMFEKSFGKYEDLKDLVSTMTDQDIWKLNRGGHDPHKVYAAYHAAMQHKVPQLLC